MNTNDSNTSVPANDPPRKRGRPKKNTGLKPAHNLGPGLFHLFKPGESGNISGPPRTFTTELRRLLSQIHPEYKSEFKDLMCRAMILKAMSGDVQAASWIAERTDGKVKDTLEITRGSDPQFMGKSNQELAEMLINAQAQSIEVKTNSVESRIEDDGMENGPSSHVPSPISGNPGVNQADPPPVPEQEPPF